MGFKLLGKKRGMTQVFDEVGNVVTCTVIHAEPSVVTQIKRRETDGYNALQLGFEKMVTKDPRTLERRLTKQLQGHFKKANVEPRRHLAEARVENVDEYQLGQEIGVAAFSSVAYVDVSGVSKGKGYQGVIKRWGFAGGPAAHGSGFHRHGGSVGQRTTPGRTYPNLKKAGRMGGDQVTVQNLRVVKIDEKRNLILVEGAVPGPRGGVVALEAAGKKVKKNKK
jgi:large subunit ribosomal protein L3